MRIMLITAALLLMPVLASAQVGTPRPDDPGEEQERDPQAPRQAILEPPGPDQGYYYVLGGNFLTVTTIDEGVRLPTLYGWSGTLRIGQSVTSWMDLGIAAEYGQFSGEGERDGSTMGLGLDWTLHPVDTLFVRLGAGLALNRVSAPVNSVNKADLFGAGVQITVGYGWFPFYDEGETGSWAANPVLHMRLIDPFFDDSAYQISIGIELTRWSGLQKNQLDLSLDEAFGSGEE